MGKYIYKLLGYHAVKEAEIKLDGITVLSGINGCGKSTLSRWLYYLINGSRDFDIFLLRDYKAKIDNLINRCDLLVWIWGDSLKKAVCWKKVL